MSTEFIFGGWHIRFNYISPSFKKNEIIDEKPLVQLPFLNKVPTFLLDMSSHDCSFLSLCYLICMNYSYFEVRVETDGLLVSRLQALFCQHRLMLLNSVR